MYLKYDVSLCPFAADGAVKIQIWCGVFNARVTWGTPLAVPRQCWRAGVLSPAQLQERMLLCPVLLKPVQLTVEAGFLHPLTYLHASSAPRFQKIMLPFCVVSNWQIFQKKPLEKT
jgi:hypothetical protein